MGVDLPPPRGAPILLPGATVPTDPSTVRTGAEVVGTQGSVRSPAATAASPRGAASNNDPDRLVALLAADEAQRASPLVRALAGRSRWTIIVGGALGIVFVLGVVMVAAAAVFG